jgi:hypothetical protein
MVPNSLTLIWLSLGAVASGLLLFGIAYLNGAFENPKSQAMDIFDERDLLIERPWETESEKNSRKTEFGFLVSPAPSEWGQGSL